MSTENLPQVAEESDVAATEPVPRVGDTPPTEDVERVDAATDAYLRAERIIKAINENLPKGSKPLAPIPTEYVFRKKDRETVSVAFHAAFELAGGVSRFAQWAADEPDKFYALYAKLLPSNTETPVGNTIVNVISQIPETAQDRVTIDDAGTVHDAAFTEVPDEELPE